MHINPWISLLLIKSRDIYFRKLLLMRILTLIELFCFTLTLRRTNDKSIVAAIDNILQDATSAKKSVSVFICYINITSVFRLISFYMHQREFARSHHLVYNFLMHLYNHASTLYIFSHCFDIELFLLFFTFIFSSDSRRYVPVPFY
jgi:hypothetical protein